MPMTHKFFLSFYAPDLLSYITYLLNALQHISSLKLVLLLLLPSLDLHHLPL